MAEDSCECQYEDDEENMEHESAGDAGCGEAEVDGQCGEEGQAEDGGEGGFCTDAVTSEGGAREEGGPFLTAARCSSACAELVSCFCVK